MASTNPLAVILEPPSVVVPRQVFQKLDGLFGKTGKFSHGDTSKI